MTQNKSKQWEAELEATVQALTGRRLRFLLPGLAGLLTVETIGRLVFDSLNGLQWGLRLTLLLALGAQAWANEVALRGRGGRLEIAAERRLFAAALVTVIGLELLLVSEAGFYSPVQLILGPLLAGLGAFFPLTLTQAVVIGLGSGMILFLAGALRGQLVPAPGDEPLAALIWLGVLAGTGMAAVAGTTLGRMLRNHAFDQGRIQHLYRELAARLESLREYSDQLSRSRQHTEELLNIVIPIGAALVTEQDLQHLMDRLVQEARTFTNADGGSLYLVTPQGQLEFVVVVNESLGIHMGGVSGNPVNLAPVPLYDPASGAPNRANVVSQAVLSGETIHIADAYAAQDFDFSGTRRFDTQMGYRSTSFLTIPLKKLDGTVVGALQLINCKDGVGGAVVPFQRGLVMLVESLSQLATAALQAYQREQELRQEIQQLRIELDEARRDKQVAEVAQTDYFQALQEKVGKLRKRRE